MKNQNHKNSKNNNKAYNPIAESLKTTKATILTRLAVFAGIAVLFFSLSLSLNLTY